MNRNIAKLAFVGVALATSAGSMADIVTASTGNGELTLYVRDIGGSSPNTRVYARGLGIQIDSVLSSATIGSGSFNGTVQNFAFVLPSPIAADSNLSSFLAGGTATSQYVWTVMGGDTELVDGAPGDYRFFTTSPTNFSANLGARPTGGQLDSQWSQLNGMETVVNANLPNPAGSSTTTGGQWGQAGSATGGSADTWFGAGTSNINNLGAAARVYVIANASDALSSEFSRIYQAVDLRLTSSGTLESVSAGVVPLPPAIWLLGSALVGLAGVARRRNVVPMPA